MVKFASLAKLTDGMLQKVMTEWFARPTGKRSAISQPTAALNVKRMVIFARLAVFAATCSKKVAAILLTRPQWI
jgi:hypothetical protein